MALMAMAVPILPDKVDAWRAFTDQLNGARKAEFQAARRALGVRERAFLQHTPMGEYVIVTLEGDDPTSAFAAFGTATDAFSAWFRQQVLDVHGFDLAAPPSDPVPELVADSGAI